MMRLAFGMIVAATIGVIGILLIATCVPEARARQRAAWQMGVCLETPYGTQCGLHDAPYAEERQCRAAMVELQGEIVVGRARCAKVPSGG